MKRICAISAVLGVLLCGCADNRPTDSTQSQSDISGGYILTSENSTSDGSNSNNQISDSQTPQTQSSQNQSSQEQPTESQSAQSGNTDNENNKDMENIMIITIGEHKLKARLADNSSVAALKELLAEGPLTIEMSDYGNMEKVGSIGRELPRNDEQISTDYGDIILYQGRSLVIYYDQNDWNFTRIGWVLDVTQAELKDILGEGNVSVTFSLE